MLKVFIVVLIGLISTAQAQTKSSDSFAKIRPLLFQVKTSSSDTAEKNSYGTGFVIHANGILATNYHVISSAIWNTKKTGIYVLENNRSLPAQIISVDVVNDLALIKIDRKFPSTLAFSKNPPRQGENVFSLGLPEDLNWSVVNGTYNGILDRGPYELIHLTTPINPGMSGGPTVNPRSELIGVNVSRMISSQNISFAVPAKFLIKLLKESNLNKTMTANETIESIYAQLRTWQNIMTDFLISNLNQSKNLSGWTIPNINKKMKCWSNLGEYQDKAMESLVESCDLEHQIFLNDKIYTGVFRIEASLNKNLTLNFFQFRRLINHIIQSPVELVYNHAKNEKFSFSPPDCMTRILTHNNKTIHLQLCMQAFVPYSELFMATLKLTLNSSTSQNALIYKIYLDGFNSENMAKITRKIADVLAEDSHD